MPDQIRKLLDDVQRLDEQATPGPWTWGDNRDGLGNKLHPTAFPGKYNPIADFEYTNDEDAEFIALSRTALPKLAEALRAVLELHKPETRWSYESVPDYGFSSKDELIEFFELHHEPHNPDDVTEWQVCIHCAEIEAGAAEDYGHITALWPCKTAQAITDVLEGE